MSQTSSVHTAHRQSPNIFKKLCWILVPSVTVSTFVLLSFTSPNLPKTAAAVPYAAAKVEHLKTANLLVGSHSFESKSIQATFNKMEQTQGFYSKIFTLTINDHSGNAVELHLTDVQQTEALTPTLYFGNEHLEMDKNFSTDLGSVVFYNSSSLILEKKDGTATISRNGFVEIKATADGMISGHFKFEMEDGTNSEGSFEEVGI